jgi:hypothetical protein
MDDKVRILIVTMWNLAVLLTFCWNILSMSSGLSEKGGKAVNQWLRLADIQCIGPVCPALTVELSMAIWLYNPIALSFCPLWPWRWRPK